MKRLLLRRFIFYCHREKPIAPPRLVIPVVNDKVLSKLYFTTESQRRKGTQRLRNCFFAMVRHLINEQQLRRLTKVMSLAAGGVSVGKREVKCRCRICTPIIIGVGERVKLL